MKNNLYEALTRIFPTHNEKNYWENFGRHNGEVNPVPMHMYQIQKQKENKIRKKY